jgi:formylglycine-generating enzyme required for sulfatase activity
MRMRYIVVVAALLLLLAGWVVVVQQTKPAVPPRESTNAGGSVTSEQSKPAVPPRELTNSIGMKFVLIDPSSFKLRSESGGADEKPVRKVTLTEGFYMQVTEVTQTQWQTVMGSNPSYFKGVDLPVEQVSWEDVQEFLTKLSGKEKGAKYRLPSEAEWEYAARAGQAGEPAKLDAVAWYSENSGNKTHAVGQKQPNGWGLYDMMGNVFEWCADRFDSEWSGRSPSVDPGPFSGVSRSLRGAAWNSPAWLLPVDSRSASPPADRSSSFGFRCVREVSP